MTDPAPTTIASTSEPTGELVTAYALWAVFRRNPDAPFEIDGYDVPSVVGELDDAVLSVEGEDVTVRGFYDVSGLRADADLMVWIHGETPETLQWALRQLRRTTLLKSLLPVWNALGVHRDAEFNKRHMPSFMLGKPPQGWVTVYPFVRSYEWYLLPEEERSAMLRDHGMKGSAFRTTLANTVASFALGDYEWILALEDDDLLNLVDMMRDLRQTEARRHVREEVPFYTGRRIGTAEIVEVLQ
ncbi:chlorite dismutase [Subtercola boreus]|uniref:Coproheme decarboxylase n=1 Tax=Subtercola boreus TaxID=120213 RepID=A0A3E0W5P5_9MICO|nr:hydrogen peroxide-dependent heme synthase [Subtercola boreus]RFA17281.1 chlorite dismutase [Subtercola boreus]